MLYINALKQTKVKKEKKKKTLGFRTRKKKVKWFSIRGTITW
jgi:hypothetical protein